MVKDRFRQYLVKLSYESKFVGLLEELYTEFGEEIFEIHSITNRHLDINAFSKNFFKKSVVSDISADGNSNVQEKNIVQWGHEWQKGIEKLNGVYLIWKWVRKCFDDESADLAVRYVITGELFVNDMTNYTKTYCYAFDLMNLVKDGINFYAPLNINPPKRSDSFVNIFIQAVAYISHHIAGAAAFPSFFPILDWYYRNEFGANYTSIIRDCIKNSKTESSNIAEDRLHKHITNQFQNIIYSLNFPFRGSQCVDEETELLTPNGFKKYHELSVGDKTYVWNNGELEIQTIDKMNVSNYDGEMHEYSGRSITQCVTPEHRVLRKKFNSKNKEYVLENSSQLIDMKTPIEIPIAMKDNNIGGIELTDDQIKLLTIILTDGSIGCGDKKRIRIFKSNNRYGQEEIEGLLSKLNIGYSTKLRKCGFDGCEEQENFVRTYNLLTNDAIDYFNILEGTKKKIPDLFLNMSKSQATVFIKTWAKYDGYKKSDTADNFKLQCDNYTIADSVQHIAFLAGYGSKRVSRLIGKNKKETIYVIIYDRKDKSCSKKIRKHYIGKVWCPTTKAGVVVFRKNGGIFISGNSPFTNLSILDRPFLTYLFKDMIFPDGKYADIDSTYELGKLFFEYFNEINCKENVFTFPIMTLSISTENLEDGSRKYLDQEFVEWVTEVNREKDLANIFVDSPQAVSSCCRLKSDITKFGDQGYVNSFGVSGVSVGSLRVCGINFPRMALLEKELQTKDEIDKLWRDRLEIIYKILYSHRQLIKDEIERGLQPLYSSNWISLNRQYSTVGFIGASEYVENHEKDIKTEESINLLMDRFKIIQDEIDRWQFKHKDDKDKYIFNVEQIPGEAMAVRLATIDKFLGYNPKGFKLYSNQYVPLIESKVSMYDRIRIQGHFDTYTSGGSILHINIDGDELSKKQYRKILNTVLELKTTYFAFNRVFSRCCNGHITYGKNNEECPMCGSDKLVRYSRVVGFLTPINAWNSIRRDYEFPNRKFYDEKIIFGDKQNDKNKEEQTDVTQ